MRIIYTLAPVFADVAQMVEQFTRNDQVSGSIPLIGSILTTACLSASGYSFPSSIRGN